ncbi:MAG: RHS repeat-associated core domain-containing protein [Shewanella sp.]|nr:RHS repeat-associated core domain-containing protein [Shewanella sp.]
MLGTPVMETDESGNVISRSVYEPFGKRLGGEKAGIGYTGHLQDEDLGLTYMQARYYDPLMGRFYSNDPVGYTAKNPVMSFNRYMYVNNNPYKYTDPNGEFLIGALFNAALDITIQLVENGGNISKVDPLQVAGAFVMGAIGAGIGEKIAKAASIVSKVTKSKAVGATLDVVSNTTAGFTVEAVKGAVLATADAVAGKSPGSPDQIDTVLGAAKDSAIGSTANQVISSATGNSKLGQVAAMATTAATKLLE